MLISCQWFYISEASKERNKIPKGSDVWIFLSWHCVFDICNAPICWDFLCASYATRTRSFVLYYLQNLLITILSPMVIKKWSFKGNSKNPKRLWCLKWFQSEFHLWSLWLSCSLGSLLRFIWSYDKKYSTLRCPKLLLLLLYRHRFSISETSRERTQAQRVSYVWTCFSQRWIFDLCGTNICWVFRWSPYAPMTRNIAL